MNISHDKKNLLQYLTLATAFLLPLKLAAAYVVAIPGILIWLYVKRFELPKALLKPEPIMIPWLLFVLVMITSSLFGLAPLRSLSSISSLVFYSLLIPWFKSSAPLTKTIQALLIGSSIASFKTCFQYFLSTDPSRIFLGPVTEAQQLAIIIPIAFALAFEKGMFSKFNWISYILYPVVTLCLIISGFENLNGLPVFALISLLFIAILFVRDGFLTFLPLLLAALVLNLKRGPWLGVVFGIAYLLLSCKKRLALFLVAVCITLACLLPPVMSRINDSYRDFTIPGGRSLIWTIGGELLTEFPLGIGFNNSKVLREFSKEIPPELRHFHSNFINIVVEGGWLSFGAFLWFLVSTLRFGALRSAEFSLLRRGLVAGLISWQVAGIGEYNVGDSEVILVAFLCLGLLGSSDFKENRPPTESSA